jgi:hypothetical protein
MPPENAVDRWSKHIQDVLATNEKVREGLTDDEALPLMDWGIQYAGVLAARLTVLDRPEPDEEQVNNVAYSLTRLMTRLNWLVTYRDKKDAAWLTQTFQMVNKLSQELLSDDAPVFSEEEIAAWIAGHHNHTNGELIQNFMARLIPSAMVAPESEPPVEPTPEPPAAPPPESPPSPLSNWVFGARLPGRSETDVSNMESDSSDQSGDKYD